MEEVVAVISNKPIIGVASCLVGQPVRYNGESKRKNTFIQSLENHLSFKTYCPEMAIGMGVPRETIRLVGALGSTRLMDSNSQTKDFTEPMQGYAKSVLSRQPELAGYILVKGSPSCGYERVKRYNEEGNPIASDAVGIFAAELRERDPLLPMEEDGRLNDHLLRENFVTRVYAYHDWKGFAASEVTHRGLIEFWSRYKYLVMAHNSGSYKAIGRLLADSNYRTVDIMAEQFIRLLMASLQKSATRKTHSNVLEHVRGYLKKHLSKDDKQELSGLITQYRQGVVPLVVPLTLLKHHFKRHKNSYIAKQVFFMPYPEQLSLRNNI